MEKKIFFGHSQLVRFVFRAIFVRFNPPVSKASREVENFDWRKKHTPTRMCCQNFVCLSVFNKIQPKLSQD